MLSSYTTTDGTVLLYVTTRDGVSIFGHSGEPRDLVLPAEINGVPVAAVEESAFRGSATLRSITIPEGVTTIGFYAFEGAANLERVAAPSSLRYVGGRAFVGCAKLRELTFPADLETVREDVFRGASLDLRETFSACRRFAAVALSDLPGSLGDACLWYEFDPQNADAPITIGGYAGDPEQIALPASIAGRAVAAIGRSAFWGADNLRAATLPETAELVDEFAFFRCPALESVRLPNSLRRIGDFAFCHCPRLATPTPGDSVSVGFAAFRP